MKQYCVICDEEKEYQILNGNDYAELRDGAHAVLWGSAHAVLWGSAHAVLRGSAHAVLWDSAHAELWDSAHAVLRGRAHAELWDSAHAVLWGSAHAELRDSAHVELWDSAHADCKSPYAITILKSKRATSTGNTIGDKPISPKEYLLSVGVTPKNQFVVLYKSVKKDFTCNHLSHLKYEIGKWIIAPDWDAKSTKECGKGLHLSPTVSQARSFFDNKTYLACRVNIKDIASLSACAQCPDKIRVRACKPLYQVNEKGEKI